MIRRPLFVVALLATVFPVVASAQTESEFYGTPKTAPEFWRAARFEIRIGNFERAAERLKGLLDLNPDDKVLFDLVDKPPQGVEGGMAPFLRLRNVPRWSAEDRKDKEARASVETLVTKLTKAIETELSNPERIRRFANSLAGQPEEATFALKEIRRSGKSAVPVLVQMLAEAPSAELRAGIVNALPELDSVVVPPLLAFVPKADPQSQADVMTALVRRGDFRSQILNADSDPVPLLWYLWGNPAIPATVKQKAREGLISAIRLDPEASADKAEDRAPYGRLTAFARQFYTGTSNLTKIPGDANGDPVHSIWTWDGKTLTEKKVDRSTATEHYGLRYARWALELQPDNVDAQVTFLGLAIESHAHRAGGVNDLAKSAPLLYAALVTAPYELLANLVEDAMRQKKTSVVLAVVRVLGERNEPKAAVGSGKPGGGERPALLVKALDYDDPRVQFAAADGLLRSTVAPAHGRTAQIVKILAGAVGAFPAEGAQPKALLADPDQQRAESVAGLLRRLGFEIEQVKTGRELFRRLHERSDIDLLMIDRHVADPLLPDLIPQLRADRRGRGLPVFLIASPDGLTPVNLFTALGRLAVVVSFEDLPLNPYVDYSPGRKDQGERVRRTPDETTQDLAFRHAAQVKRMTEIVQQAGFSVNEEMRDRIAYLSLQTFSPEVLNAFSRQLVAEERVVVFRLLPPQIIAEASDAPLASLKPRMRADAPPSQAEMDRIVELMRLTGRIEAGLQVDRIVPMTKTWDMFWNPAAPRLPPAAAIRHPEIEAKLQRVAAPYRNVRVVPAVFTETGFKAELAQAADPKAPIGSPAEKKEMAKTAIKWLRKMAVGEVRGYPVADAVVAIREAMLIDELAPDAIEAMVRISSKEGQQDLANLAIDAVRPAPLRSQAAGALVRNIQAFGKFVTEPQSQAIFNAVSATEDAELKGRLLAAVGVITSDSKRTAGRLKEFIPTAPVAPPAPGKEDPKEEKKD